MGSKLKGILHVRYTVLPILTWSTKLPKWFPKVPACAQSDPHGDKIKENPSKSVSKV